MVTSGAAEAYTKVLEMCVKEGDKVLVEIPTFSSAIDNLLTLGAEPLGVQGDDHGMIPGELRNIMSKWRPEDADNPHSDVPKLMYVIPSSSNPSGATLPLERKREIYEIAREYNLLIIEDDPYYFLQFGSRLEPSFLSIDTDGRVLRADSFSKCMTAGLRLGILSGPDLLVSKVQSHVGFSQEHSNNLAQAVLHKIFEAWGEQGTKKRWREVSALYERQKNAMVSSAKKWLTGLAEFVEPQGGMYLWIRLTTIPDSRKLIEEKALAHNIAMAPGCIFSPNRDVPSPYLRASYSTISVDQIDVAMQRLAEVIKEEMACKS
ncbi:kynurenine/alpha-aminoadipate aminotransferase, mitochondrial-like [Lingula anatina]|uniref:Kynurenine/alpha-aminoadipate aminotransferase, mitochondrial-like n=1 Tax=Lingula anatina TaxID=7574 RepID=A0A1S3K3X6_LINAN|nr:kynurenine/alpha-aminoadipate aminotransferase, mitochondrial-like [Lingula anatina]|eukprot:XP_013417330.1 kynurenine/alpha-aminoadipate aminotransferase, mitochondrial-like [Lingula anatina]